MVAKRIGIHDLRFEEKDAEIFKIADTKTRLDTLQNYFFPRLEVLLQDTVSLVQDIYDVNPYERMAVTSRPRHRKEARQNLDYGEVHIGHRGKRRRAGSISEIASVLTYTVYPEGSLQVVFKPFVQKVNSEFISAIAGLIRNNIKALSPVLALWYVVHS